ncbi:MAG: cytochrome c oxidase subunit II [Planctomycetes bacterium]|nr:cytochrome c oxidase subunit II [Planctomycetota bacterium]
MLPHDISTYGDLIDNVLLIIFIGGAAVAVFAFAFVIYTLFRFHHTKNPSANPSIGNASKLMYLVGFMVLFDLLIAFMSGEAWAEVFLKDRNELVKSADGNVVSVNVIGRQFFWSFLYDGPDKTANTNDDFTIAGELVVPVDTVILLNLTSGDVIHSFFAPNLRLKYDAIPGRTIHTWFKAKETGSFEIACAELCGSQHYKMKAMLKVVSKDEFKKWLNERS